MPCVPARSVALGFMVASLLNVAVGHSQTEGLVLSMQSDRLQSSLIRSSPNFDLTPSELIQGAAALKMGALQMEAYVACLFLVSSLLVLAYHNRGIKTCAAIVAYVMSLSFMSVLVKNVYAQGFTYPQFTTACHFLTTASVGCGILLFQGGRVVMPSPKTLCCGIVPVAMSTALSIGMANLGLMYCSAHFYEMLSGLTCLVTAGLGLALGRPIHQRLFVPLLLITLGLLIVSFGEISFSLFAVICVFLAVFFRATKAQLQSLLLSPDSGLQQLAPLELVVWSCISCFAIMAVWSLVAEGTAPFEKIQDAHAALAVVLSAGPACLLNIAALYVLKEVGPVAQQAIGALKGVLACASAVVVFGEVITLQQVAGYSVLIAACVWYNRVDSDLKRSAKEAAAASEKTPLVVEKRV